MPIDLSSMAIVPPPIPDKNAIIPIHTSDRASFKRCRRYWNWTSPMRNNLRPMVITHGINFPLWFGTGIHYALEQYYQPGISRDPVEAFTYWFDLQWNGGICSEDELRLTYDPNPKWASDDEGGHDLESVMPNPVYSIRGLRDLLPEPSENEFLEHRELGIRMMQFYKTYSEKNDNFRLIAAEHDFSVPIFGPPDTSLALNPKNPDWNLIYTDRQGHLMALDVRDNVYKPVHCRGRMDLILQDQETGQYGIKDHKTTAVMEDEDQYNEKLVMDEQTLTYHWAAETEAALYDLPYQKIDFVVYQAMRKAYPKPPTSTSRAPFVSINRQTESTTYEIFMQYIAEEGIDVVVQNNDKVQEYIAYLREIGDKQFINRVVVRRNRHELSSVGQRIFLEAVDMLNNPSIYPNARNDFMCLGCAFRAPCIASNDGSDAQFLIDNNYEKNRDR